MEETNKKGRATSEIVRGIKNSLPVGLGYIPISIAFGMMMTSNNAPVWIATLASLTNFAGASQFAGMELFFSGGTYLEIAITVFIVNLRYLVMSLSLAQIVDEKMNTLQKALLSFAFTDEIFAVMLLEKEPISAKYFFGLTTTPYLGWALGTLVGGAAASFLPGSIRASLGIVLYAMFIAIIVPPAVKTKPIFRTVLIAVILSCIIEWVPLFNNVSAGWSIIICSFVSAIVTAIRYPVNVGED